MLLNLQLLHFFRTWFVIFFLYVFKIVDVGDLEDQDKISLMTELFHRIDLDSRGTLGGFLTKEQINELM